MNREESIALGWWSSAMRTATDARRASLNQVHCDRCDDPESELQHEESCRWWSTPASRSSHRATAAYWLDSAGRARRKLQHLRSDDDPT